MEHAIPRAAVSGMGVVSAAGIGCDALRRSILAGCSSLRPWPAAPLVTLGLAPGGAHYLETRSGPSDDQARCVSLGIRAAHEALEAAGFVDRPSRANVALVLGTNVGDRPAALHELAATMADALGLDGPRLVVMLACASSTAALGVAHRLLAEGDASAVVAGGSDLTTPLVLAGFQALGLLAPSPCTPLGPTTGTSLGEGAGFVVLELEHHARERGVQPRFLVRGHGLAADAYHPTRPEPNGRGLSHGILSALRHASIDGAALGHVNVHGTGTEANDVAEWRGLQRALGEHTGALWVSASKGMLGHAQGAAGILELLTTLLAWEQRLIPSTHVTDGLRPGCEGMRIAVGTPQPWSGTVAAVINSGFGGLNAVTVLERLDDDDTSAPHPGLERARPCARAAILGYAIHNPRSQSRAGDEVDLHRLLRGADLEVLDPTTRSLCRVTRLALHHAGIGLDRRTRERIGLFGAVYRTSPQRVRELERSIDSHGAQRMSASSFVHALITTPLGTCAELLGLRGPVNLLSAGRAGGLVAGIVAAGWLCEHDDVDFMVASAADEGDEADGTGAWEGGAGLVLGRPSPGCILLAGHAIVGPSHPEQAVKLALARARLHLDDIDSSWGDAVTGHGGPRHPVELGHTASTGSVALAMAARALERREAHRALVYVAEPSIAGVAAILTRED